MTIRKLLISGLAALALTAAGARAQEILGVNPVTGYATGDLLLAFYSSSVANDLVFDIGPSSSYVGLAAGTYSVDEFNGSATLGQPSVGSGNSDFVTNFTNYTGGSGAQPYWTVAGANNATNQLWITSTSASNVQKAQTNLLQGGIVGEIDTSVGDDAKGNPNAAGASPNSDSLLSDKPVFGTIGSTNIWSSGEKPVNSVTAGTTTLYLWELDPTAHGTANGTDLGFFTLNSGTGTVSFTVIPEPSNYAAILGALTVGFMIVHRRFRSSGLNTLA